MPSVAGRCLRSRTLQAEIESNDWTLSDDALAVLLDGIATGARTIVECGSGRSTILIARRLAELGEGGVHSLEHDPNWANSTRSHLEQEGLRRAHVIIAPLEPHPLAGPAGWYRLAAVADLPPAIDLLLIDGPPAGEPGLQRSRHPALAELGGLLAPGATIVVDDAWRPGETDALDLWTRTYGLRFELDTRSGTAVAKWPL